MNMKRCSTAPATIEKVLNLVPFGSGAAFRILLDSMDSIGEVWLMPRALRHQYPEAVYHVMGRGDGGKAIFEEDADGKAFLFRLGQVCASHGWRVHAWVLMKNHFD